GVDVALSLRAKFRSILRSRSIAIHILSHTSTMTATSTPPSATNVPILPTANYSLWAPAMEDYLRAKGMWYWIHRSPPDERSDPKGNRKCLESKDQAVGEIRRHLSLSALLTPHPRCNQGRLWRL